MYITRFNIHIELKLELHKEEKRSEDLIVNRYNRQTPIFIY